MGGTIKIGTRTRGKSKSPPTSLLQFTGVLHMHTALYYLSEKQQGPSHTVVLFVVSLLELDRKMQVKLFAQPSSSLGDLEPGLSLV